MKEKDAVIKAARSLMFDWQQRFIKPGDEIGEHPKALIDALAKLDEAERRAHHDWVLDCECGPRAPGGPCPFCAAEGGAK